MSTTTRRNNALQTHSSNNSSPDERHRNGTVDARVPAHACIVSDNPEVPLWYHNVFRRWRVFSCWVNADDVSGKTEYAFAYVRPGIQWGGQNDEISSFQRSQGWYVDGQAFFENAIACHRHCRKHRGAVDLGMKRNTCPRFRFSEELCTHESWSPDVFKDEVCQTCELAAFFSKSFKDKFSTYLY